MPQVMEATLRGELKGQEIINRWNFIANGTPAAVSMSFALASAMGMVRGLVSPFYPADGYLTTMAAFISEDYTFRELIVADHYSVTDFYTVPYINGESGVATGLSLSPINAYGFRTNRTRSDIARGMKRFAGVTQGATGDGGTFVSGATTLLNAMAAKMSEVLEYDDDGNALTFTPCVIKRYKPPVAPGERQKYEYYPTPAEQLANVATSIVWEPYQEVRGQSSRQYGKGS